MRNRARIPGFALVFVLACLAARSPAAPGALDPLFGGGGVVTNPVGSADDRALGVAVQPDGKIVVAGYAYNGSDPELAIVRYNTNGTLDTTFSGDGILTLAISNRCWASGVALQADGKIAVAGASGPALDEDFAVARFTSLGALDTTFGGGTGFVTTAIGTGVDMGAAVVVQTNGRIVVAGTSRGATDNNFAVLRYSTNGALDTSFSTDGKQTTDILTDDSAYGVTLQADGKIVVGGSAYNGSNEDLAVVRYTAAGGLDATFSGDGKVTTAVSNSHDECFCVAVQSDGKIVAAGSAWLGPNVNFAVVRYTAAGALDTTFSGDGKATTHILGDDVIRGVVVQSNGMIVSLHSYKLPA